MRSRGRDQACVHGFDRARIAASYARYAYLTFSLPSRPFPPYPAGGGGGRKFVFPVWIFLCLRVDIVRLATNRPSFLKRYPAFCPCATLSKTSLEYGENVGERYPNVLLLLLRKSSRREFVLSISVDGGLVPVTSVFSAKSLSRVPHFQ